MKNLIILIYLFAGSYATNAFAQTKSKEVTVTEPVKPSVYKDLLNRESNDIYTKVDKYPEYPGGMEAIQNFFTKNLHTGGETGRVIATFVVEKDGSVSNVEVIRTFSDKAKQEATRVLKRMPKWKPGIDKGKVVRTRFTIPISFQKIVK